MGSVYEITVGVICTLILAYAVWDLWMTPKPPMEP